MALSIGVAASPWLTGCDRSSPTGFSSETRQTSSKLSGALRGWNLLLISSDTTRADHLGCYGYQAARTPNLDALAKAGVVFEQCMTSAPVTLPAHASMLTGLYPFTHGARDNGQFFVPDACETLAESLRNAGYATAAEVGTYILNREYGLSQGFSTYGDVEAVRHPQLASGPGDAVNYERRGGDVADEAIKWLRGVHGQPFFLFVHFYDPHATYAPPPKFSRAASPYDGEISYVDELVGRLKATLTEIGAGRNTLIVFTADHGEGLNEHEEATHAYFVYDSTMHIPLILHAPGVAPTGKRVTQQVRLVDLTPTLLDLLGVGPSAKFDGVSLSAAISNDVDLRLTAYGETFYPRMTLGYCWYRCLRADGWKYIHGPKPELYHVADDPRELNNLVTSEAERITKMRASLRELLETARRVDTSAPATRAVSETDRRALESLGYISSGGGGTELAATEIEMFDPVGDPPRELAEENNAMARILTLMSAGRLDAAITQLRQLIHDSKRSTTFWWAHETLGEALEARENFAEAADAFRAALEIRPSEGRTRARMANALARTGKLDEALREFQRALGDPPVFGVACHEYGLALAQAGKSEEAIAQQREAIRLDPLLGRAYTELARLLASAGRADEAIVVFQQGISAAPTAVGLRLSLARALTDAKRYDDAIAALRDAAKTLPKDESISLELAWLLATASAAPDGAGKEALSLLGPLQPTKDIDVELRRLDARAAALAATDQFAEAIKTIDEAVAKARDKQRFRTLAELTERRAIYERGQRFTLPQ